MKLLVTGGCGFLGSHFIRARLREYPSDTVHNIDCLTYAGSVGNLEEARENPRYSHQSADIAADTTWHVLRDISPDIIIHFAAETHVDRSLEDPDRFIRTNLLGTQKLLSECLRLDHDAGPIPIIIISTDEVYGPAPEGTAFDPSTPVAPTSPYAMSKAAADMTALAYAQTAGLDVTILRSVNVYGPHQFPEKFIPLFTMRALAGKALPLYGDGRQLRCWLFVDDYVAGVQVLIANPERRRKQPIWHLGAGNTADNRGIAEKICRLCDADPALITLVRDRPNHDRRYALDFEQTTVAFGWQPRVALPDGLTRTVEWIREHRGWHADRAGWTPAFLSSE